MKWQTSRMTPATEMAATARTRIRKLPVSGSGSPPREFNNFRVAL